MLRAAMVTKSYRRSLISAAFTAVKEVSVKIRENEILGLMGPSGCGKSTLARILTRLVSVDSGTLFFYGDDVTAITGRRLKDYRRQVQLIAQDPRASFDPAMPLGKSLREPLKIYGEYQKEKSLFRIEKGLEEMQLSEKLLLRYPHQVSGGEIQRLALCRALLLNPKVLVLDEATSMLDVSSQAQIFNLLMGIKQEKKISYLLISHDREIVHRLSDRVLMMDSGSVVAED